MTPKPTLAIVVLVACQKPTLSLETRSDVLAQRHAQIEQIGRGCEPDDWARLISISAGKYEWHDALASADDPDGKVASNTRCWAVESLMQQGPLLPVTFNGAFERRYAARLDVPEIRDSLSTMLVDHIDRCKADGAELAMLISGVVLIPSLEAKLDAIGVDQVSRVRAQIQSWHPGARARRVDATVAERQPDSFVRVLEMLSPFYLWGDGSSPPNDDERGEIKEHVLSALLWLEKLSHQRSEWRCVGPLKTAIADGRLGAVIVERLDDPDPKIRAGLLSVLLAQPRRSSRDRLQDIAEHDPEATVRTAAGRALDLLDQGGD